MRILHTADWHLGKRLGNFSRIEEQKLVLDEICLIAENEAVDAIIIAGDLFDIPNPSAEAEELFYLTLHRLSKGGRRLVVAIAGNHDAPERIEAPDPLARMNGIVLLGYPKSTPHKFNSDFSIALTDTAPGFASFSLPGFSYPLRVLLTPYANEYRLKTFLGVSDTDSNLREHLAKHWKSLADEYCDKKGVNILVSHLYMMEEHGEQPEEPDDEKHILRNPSEVGAAMAIYTRNIPDQIQYTALGHLHRRRNIPGAKGITAYSGSPLQYSFSEAGQQKVVTIMDIEPDKKPTLTDIPLTQGRPLLRKKAHSIDEAVNWLEEHPDALIDLTLVSKSFIAAEDRRRILRANPGIVNLVPVILREDGAVETEIIDLSQDIEILFEGYYQSKYKHSPDDDIKTLFREILNS